MMKFALTATIALATMSAAACVVEDSADEPIGDSSLEVTDADCVALSDEDAAADTLSALAAPRHNVAYSACHTFDYLRNHSDLYCRLITGNSYDFAVARNYTQGCTGWWGAGAQRVWFSCASQTT